MRFQATSDISFDRLNALVDHELDPIEEGRILDAMRREPDLESVACELRMTKEMIRHAYLRETPTPRLRPGGFRGNWRWLAVAAVALVTVGAGGGWLGHAWYEGGGGADFARLAHGPDVPPSVAASNHVVLHISSSAPDRVSGMLREAEGMLQAARGTGRPVAIEIVANNSGLDVLRVDRPTASRVLALRSDYPNLTLVACGQTLERLRAKGVNVQLLPGTTVASSALDEIVKRIREGWTYVRA